MELRLGSCLYGGYIDDMVSDLLDIKLQKEYPLLMIAVGSINE